MIARASKDEALLRAVIVRLRHRGHRTPVLQARVAIALLHELGGSAERPAASGSPNLAQLAERLGVHRATLTHAVAALRRKGWLTERVECVTVERVVREVRTVRRMTLTLPAGLPGEAELAEVVGMIADARQLDLLAPVAAREGAPAP